MSHISQVKGMQNNETYQIKKEWILTGSNGPSTWKLTPREDANKSIEKTFTFSHKSDKI